MTCMRHLCTLVLCAAIGLLAGCAGPRLVESDVSSFSTLTALPSPPTYRIARPSRRRPKRRWHAWA